MWMDGWTEYDEERKGKEMKGYSMRTLIFIFEQDVGEYIDGLNNAETFRWIRMDIIKKEMQKTFEEFHIIIGVICYIRFQ